MKDFLFLRRPKTEVEEKGQERLTLQRRALRRPAPSRAPYWTGEVCNPGLQLLGGDVVSEKYGLGGYCNECCCGLGEVFRLARPVYRKLSKSGDKVSGKRGIHWC